MPVYLNQDSKHEPEKKNTLQWIGIFLKYVFIHDSFILLLVLSFVFFEESWVICHVNFSNSLIAPYNDI